MQVKHQILSWSFQNARGKDFSTEPNYGHPYVVMGRPLYSATVVSSFILFPRLFSAVADEMSTILLHMVWP